MRVAKFEKVSFDQYKEDYMDTRVNIKDNFLYTDDWHDDTVKYIKNIYDNIKLPQRATMGSAGYDFYAPYYIEIKPYSYVTIPTGIRCRIDDEIFLALFPRSGQGFKTGVRLANSTGIIDNDYYYSDNEGHIFVKLVNDSVLSKTLEIKQGEAFCQGIFIPFGVTYNDNATDIRNGGFGSTSK